MIRVEPTLAPSMTASDGAKPIAPLAVSEVAINPLAALQHCGYREAGQKGIEARPSSGARQGAPEPTTQFGAETTLDAGADHVRAPEKEPDIAAQLQKGHGT